MSDDQFQYNMQINQKNMPPEVKSYISSLELKRTMDAGTGSMCRFVIEDPDPSAFSIIEPLLDLEARIKVWLKPHNDTAGRNRPRMVFHGFIIAVEPILPADKAPSIVVTCHDYSYILKRQLERRRVPEVHPGDTYRSFFNRELGQYRVTGLEGKQTRFAIHKDSDSILDSPMGDDEAWPYGGIASTSVDVLGKNPDLLIEKTTAEFGDTIWMLLSKLADRFNLFLFCVEQHVFLVKPDYTFRPQDVQHRFVYRPNSDQQDFIPLLSAKIESSVGGNVSIVEVHYRDVTDKQHPDVSMLRSFLDGARLRGRSEPTIGARQQETFPLPLHPAERLGIFREHGGVSASDQEQLSDRYQELWRDFADMLGVFSDFIDPNTYAADIAIALEKSGFKWSDPLGVDQFQEARISDIKRRHFPDSDEEILNVRMNDEPAVVEDQGLRTKTQAERAAEAIFEKSLLRLTELTGEVEGLPTLFPGHKHTIEINALSTIGEEYSSSPTEGYYHIKSVEHRIDENGFRTKFTAGAPFLRKQGNRGWVQE